MNEYVKIHVKVDFGQRPASLEFAAQPAANAAPLPGTPEHLSPMKGNKRGLPHGRYDRNPTKSRGMSGNWPGKCQAKHHQ